MAQFELQMPKLGESIEEATVTKWFVKVGDKIDDDDVLLEIATDKVDSEIPSPVSGTIIKINVEQDQTVPVGTIIAVIDTSGGDVVTEDAPVSEKEVEESAAPASPKADIVETVEEPASQAPEKSGGSGRFQTSVIPGLSGSDAVKIKLSSIFIGCWRTALKTMRRKALFHIKISLTEGLRHR